MVEDRLADPTLITLLFESVLPSGSDTVSVTVYSPASVYV